MAEDAPIAFVSYSSKDSEFALRLAKDLKAAGANVWLDQLDIAPGQRWDRAVEQALQRYPHMLLILSPAAVESDNVMDEVSFALEERKTVIPILSKDCAIPFRLRRVQYIDFRTDYQRGLKELVRTLDTVPAAEKAKTVAKPETSEHPEPASSNRRLLSDLIPPTSVSLSLKQMSYGVYETKLEPKYLNNTRMYLAVAADVSDDTIIRGVPLLLKVCSATHIDQLVSNALPGITLTHIPRPPNAISIKMKYQYFSLTQTGAAWEAVKRACNFAVYVPADIANPHIELVILLSQAD